MQFHAEMCFSDEQVLRAKIAKLQEYRRLGLTTAADIEAYHIDLQKRVRKIVLLFAYACSYVHGQSEAKLKHPGFQPIDRRASRGSVGPFASEDGSRASREPENRFGSISAGLPVRKGRTYFLYQHFQGSVDATPAAPLNLANSPSLHLLTPPEQILCSNLRILPKPYLVIKETLVREYARRGGKLRRREARELVKIDVNKTSRVWDFLVQAGYLRIPDVPVAGPSSSTNENGYAIRT
jgi:transcriptional adapter 2-alpha